MFAFIWALAWFHIFIWVFDTTWLQLADLYCTPHICWNTTCGRRKLTNRTTLSHLSSDFLNRCPSLRSDVFEWKAMGGYGICVFHLQEKIYTSFGRQLRKWFQTWILCSIFYNVSLRPFFIPLSENNCVRVYLYNFRRLNFGMGIVYM